MAGPVVVTRKTTIGFNTISLMDLTCARTYIPDPSSPVGLCCTSHQCSADIHNNVHTGILRMYAHIYTHTDHFGCACHIQAFFTDLTSPYVNIDKCRSFRLSFTNMGTTVYDLYVCT